MALTDGIENKLKNIANAIRSKTNKSEELTLEQMASEVSGIDTLQGLDFSSIYDQEQANEINQYYKDGIAYAKGIARTWDEKMSDSGRRFASDFNLVFFPNDVDVSKITNAYFMFNSCYRLVKLNITLPIATNVAGLCVYDASLIEANIALPSVGEYTNVFNTCYALKYANINDISKGISFSNTFRNCYTLEILFFRLWKQGDISLAQSSKLFAESLKYIIWHALNGANTLGYEDEGATSRTLTLQKETAHDITWAGIKNTTPSVKDCEFLGVDESEITKYGNLTWSQIASDVKLITITA